MHSMGLQVNFAAGLMKDKFVLKPGTSGSNMFSETKQMDGISSSNMESVFWFLQLNI